MLLPSSSAKLLRFGIFELDCQARELRRRGAKVKLQDQSLLVLETLLENAGNVVQREVLQKRMIVPSTSFASGRLTAASRRMPSTICATRIRPLESGLSCVNASRLPPPAWTVPSSTSPWTTSQTL